MNMKEIGIKSWKSFNHENQSSDNCESYSYGDGNVCYSGAIKISPVEKLMTSLYSFTF